MRDSMQMRGIKYAVIAIPRGARNYGKSTDSSLREVIRRIAPKQSKNYALYRHCEKISVTNFRGNPPPYRHCESLRSKAKQSKGRDSKRLSNQCSKSESMESALESLKVSGIAFDSKSLK